MNTILVGKDCKGNSLEIGDTVMIDDKEEVLGEIKAIWDNETVDIIDSFGMVIEHAEIKRITVKEISLIASGYDWVCPICDVDNRINHIEERITCKFCSATYKTDDNPYHATG